MPPSLSSAEGIWLATFAVAFASGIVPLLSIEVYVLAVSAASPQTGVLPVAAAATLGQMGAKSLVYLAGTGVLKLPWRKGGRPVDRWSGRLGRRGGGALWVILTSSFASVPPLYPASLAAGALRLPFARFFAVGCAGVFLRFVALFSMPRFFL
jgi:membrane protein YqaA with SNARE-associated domain